MKLKSVSGPSCDRKQIQCPKCGKRILDAAAEIHTEIREVSGRAKLIFDFYAKCERCGTEVGLRKLR